MGLGAAEVAPEEEAQVGPGKISPIVKAIGHAEQLTTGEIHVHISHRFFERYPLKSAQTIFKKYRLENTSERNGILLYINLRKKKFVVLGDEGIHNKVGQDYWNHLCVALKEDLQSTYFENAIAIAVRTMGITLAQIFPAHPNNHNKDELPNLVTRD